MAMMQRFTDEKSKSQKVQNVYKFLSVTNVGLL